MINEPKYCIPFILMIMITTYAYAEYNYGNKELATSLFAIMIICGIPMWIILKAMSEPDDKNKKENEQQNQDRQFLESWRDMRDGTLS